MRPSIPGLPLLGVVPESSALSRSAKGKKNAGAPLPASEAEPFHLIRARLRYFNVDKELRTLMVAGSSLPPNPGELIESHAMESLLQQAKTRYDLVVVDTPPLTAVSDAFPLLGKVDGVIIVGRVGRNRRDVAQRLHETLTGAGAPLLGVVANGCKSGRRGGYGYGYSYDYAAGVKGGRPADDGPPAGGASPNGAGAADAPVPTSQA
jgi:Mrp family chromosome partitioning ATPase